MTDNSTTAGFGAGTIGIGQGILLSFPNATGNVSLWNSFVTGTTDSARSFRGAVSAAEMSFSEIGRIAPLLQPGQFGYSGNWVQNLGNSATLAEAERLGLRFGDVTFDLQGKGLTRGTFTFGDGSSFHPDLQYQTRSWLWGATNHLDEVKARAFVSGSEANLSEIGNYGRAISGINAENGFYRGLGYGAKGLGILGFGYDGFQTFGSINGEIRAGDYSGAALSGAEFGGRWDAGLTLGGLGAQYGLAFGPWGSLGFGLAGGLVGAVGGQWAVDKIAGAFGISHSSQLSTTGAAASGVSALPGQSWSGADYAGTQTHVPGTTLNTPPPVTGPQGHLTAPSAPIRPSAPVAPAHAAAYAQAAATQHTIKTVNHNIENQRADAAAAAARHHASRARHSGREIQSRTARQRISIQRRNTMPHLLQRLHEGVFAGREVKLRGGFADLDYD